MARIVRTGDTPAKRRNAALRNCAELLRLLAENPNIAIGRFDGETQDMVAFLVFSLRDIHKTIEESAQAWDDRNYWKKAEELRERYRWSRTIADEIAGLAVEGNWNDVPSTLITLVPHLANVNVQQITRDADWWVGAMRALKRAEAEKTGLSSL